MNSILLENIKSIVIYTAVQCHDKTLCTLQAESRTPPVLSSIDVQNTKIFRIFLGRSKETLLTGWALGNLAEHFSRIYMFHMFRGLRFKPNLTLFLPRTNNLLPNTG